MLSFYFKNCTYHVHKWFVGTSSEPQKKYSITIDYGTTDFWMNYSFISSKFVDLITSDCFEVTQILKENLRIYNEIITLNTQFVFK